MLLSTDTTRTPQLRFSPRFPSFHYCRRRLRLSHRGVLRSITAVLHLRRPPARCILHRCRRPLPRRVRRHRQRIDFRRHRSQLHRSSHSRLEVAVNHRRPPTTSQPPTSTAWRHRTALAAPHVLELDAARAELGHGCFKVGRVEAKRGSATRLRVLVAHRRHEGDHCIRADWGHLDPAEALADLVVRARQCALAVTTRLT